jgi:hypothetical protein
MVAILADFLLIIAAIGASVYCHILSSRLKRFNALESGMGGAIAVLSSQVDEMTAALAKARNAADGSTDGLAALVQRAEASAARLEMLLASTHDLPAEGEDFPRRLRFSRRRRDGVEAAE